MDWLRIPISSLPLKENILKTVLGTLIVQNVIFTISSVSQFIVQDSCSYTEFESGYNALKVIS